MKKEEGGREGRERGEGEEEKGEDGEEGGREGRGRKRKGENGERCTEVTQKVETWNISASFKC